MRFISVCSGIEAASVAWRPLGWKAAFFSEIDAFPRAVLAHHYPDVPNLGDMTKYKDWPDATVDLLCGGTPCQSFSNAGLRAGLDDPRGQLMLTFSAIAARYRPRWLVWENVPGVLSSNGGRDFGAFLGLLGFLGYGFAYRVLDAQYVRVDGHARAVPQRRNRVFVVGCLGDWRGAAAVLLERESLRGDPAPRRSARSGVAARLTRGAESSGKGGYAGRRQEDDINIVAFDGQNIGLHNNVSGTLDTGAAHTNRGMHIAAFGGNNTRGPVSVSSALSAHGGSGRMDFETETFVAHTLRGDGFDASEDGGGRGTPLVVAPEISATLVGRSSRGGGQINSPGHNADESLIAFDTTQITSRENRSNPQPGDPCHPLAAGAHPPAIAFDARQSDVIQYGDKAGPLDTDAFSQAVCFQERGRDGGRNLEIGGDVAFALTAPAGGGRAQERNVQTGMRVRRLTPTECERLMGFPDGYTAIPWRGKPAADGPRYKALGNSWAVNCARWIGARIAMVDALSTVESA